MFAAPSHELGLVGWLMFGLLWSGVIVLAARAAVAAGRRFLAWEAEQRRVPLGIALARQVPPPPPVPAPLRRVPDPSPIPRTRKSVA